MASLSQSSNVGSSHDHHGAPTGFVKRWLYSTNHKDIGTMYIIFAIVAAFIGGAMSIYMRMELMNPGPKLKPGEYNNKKIKSFNGISVTLLGGALGKSYRKDWTEIQLKEYEEYLKGDQ